MIRTDAGATAATARYSTGSTTPGQTTRRDPSADSDPFGDLVDRYADDGPAPRQNAAASRVRTPPRTPEPKEQQGTTAGDSKVPEDSESPWIGQPGKRRVSAEVEVGPRARRAAGDEEINGDAVVVAVLPPVLPTVAPGDRRGRSGSSVQALSGMVDSAASQLASSGVSAVIAEGQDASTLADRAEKVLAGLAGAVQAQEPLNAEGTAGERMPAVHHQTADRPADQARHAARIAIDAVRNALTNDAAKNIADKPAIAETVQADAEAGTNKAATHAVPAAGQNPALTDTPVSEAGVANQAGNDAGQPQNDAAGDRHDASADIPTNRTAQANSRGTLAHVSARQAVQASQESAPTAHVATHLVEASDAAHKHASPEGETNVAPKPTARTAQAIAAFQAASMANIATGTPPIVRAQAGTASAATPALLDAELPTQIIHAIRVQAGGGSSEARVQLNPGFLGNVSVGVRIDAGAVVASLQASDPQVREWMRTNEPMLRQSLADQGLHLERLVIVDEETQSPGEGREERRDQQQQQQQAPRQRRRPSTEGTFELVL